MGDHSSHNANIKKMRAIVIVAKGKLALKDVPAPNPALLKDGEVIVRNEGAGMNPVDYKIGLAGAFHELRPDYYSEKKVLKADDPYRACNIIGTDGAGTVEHSKSPKFRKGDKVWYAGTLNKPGSFAEYTIVDSRILAIRPQNLSAADAAVLPLTFQTGWEALVEGMNIPYAPKPGTLVNAEEVDSTLLVVNGAGGAGSIGIQLAKKVLNVRTVIATASREETKAFSKKMGADGIFSHRTPVEKWNDEIVKVKEVLEVKENPEYNGGGGADFIYETHPGKHNIGATLKVLRVAGRLQTICRASDEGFSGIDGLDLTLRRLTMGSTLMFSRDLYGLKKETVGEVLALATRLCDSGVIKPHLGSSDPPRALFDSFEDAMEKQMSGKAIGKSAFFIEKTA